MMSITSTGKTPCEKKENQTRGKSSYAHPNKQLSTPPLCSGAEIPGPFFPVFLHIILRSRIGKDPSMPVKNRTVRFRGIRPGDENGRKGLRNPERGFRFEIGIGRCPEDPVQFSHIRSQWPFATYADDGITIAQAYCYLTQYSDSPISRQKLEALEADFARARESGVKFLLRFAYEFYIGDENQTGPRMQRILEHMDQLKPVLDRNWDVIYVLQTGWIGAWGEFHSSRHGLEKDPESTSAVLKKTLELLPPDRMTMMRRAQYKIDNLKKLGLFRELTPETAWTSAPEARIGFFNDGTLANYWDGGTFTEAPFFASPGNPEFDFMCRESAFLPVDGELFWSGWQDPHEPPGIRACERFHLHHYSTFSYVHGFSGLDKSPEKWSIDSWKETLLLPCHLGKIHLFPTPDYFESEDVPRTAFEYIRDHLGYRIAVEEARFPEECRPGDDLLFEADLRNYGFAAPVNPRKICFVLRNRRSGKCIELDTGMDCRTLQPGGNGTEEAQVDYSHSAAVVSPPPLHTARAAFRLPEEEELIREGGDWDVALWMPDSRESLRFRNEYAVRIASRMEWREESGRGLNILGSFRCLPAPQLPKQG